ncbi:MAG: FKBP-type peptidyl-prolyl cis-trans isomerase [Bacteroidales bacterium]|nr:FKBP-type peptidyl-prolyl cis-trans isomerase [Bacteroidales bacterium]
MKAFKFLAIAAALTMVAACGQKGGNAAEGADSLAVKKEVVKKASELLPSKAQRDSVSYLIGYVFGGYIKGYNFGDDLNYNRIKAGIEDLLKAKNTPGTPEFDEEFKISPKEIDRLFNDYLGKRFEYVKAKNLEDGQKYMEKMLKKGYQMSDKGFAYKINNPGSERKIELTDTLEVNYKGTFIDGTVFDQTNEQRGAFKLNLSEGSVIKGWIEGLQLVGDGGSISLILPSDLAYGPQGNRGIEPNKTLLFDIDVVSVKPVAEVPATEDTPAE